VGKSKIGIAVSGGTEGWGGVEAPQRSVSYYQVVEGGAEIALGCVDIQGHEVFRI